MGDKRNNNFVKPVYRKAKKETETAKKPAVVTATKAKERADQNISFVSDKMKNIENGVAVTVKVKAVSPIHLSSGQADVNVDADVVHDKYGVPYFPAKRLKGLLYESALEVKEMAETAGMAFICQKTIDELFGHISSPVQLIVEDLHLAGYEAIKEDLEYLEQRYPEYIRKEDVLQEFTSLRYQTAINRETGTAKDGSLRNIRVVDAGTEFDGVWELRNAGQEHLEALALAMQNLSLAGGKRNRGCGEIICVMSEQKELVEQAIRKDAV